MMMQAFVTRAVGAYHSISAGVWKSCASGVLPAGQSASVSGISSSHFSYFR